MAEPSTTLFIARDDGAAVACGALKRHEGSIGEVKRMYTRPSHRGRRIGAAIVERIEAPVLDYPESPYSVFYEKDLSAG